jgi:hypothetical protein
MNFHRLAAFASVAIVSLNFVQAAELAGNWTAEFDTQIGVQKYVYEFTAEGDKFTGKARYDHSMGKGESQLKDIKLESDEISFIETVNIDGMDLIITYSGKIAGDQMNLKRVVGEFATEQVIAKRTAPSKPAASAQAAESK